MEPVEEAAHESSIVDVCKLIAINWEIPEAIIPTDLQSSRIRNDFGNFP